MPVPLESNTRRGSPHNSWPAPLATGAITSRCHETSVSGKCSPDLADVLAPRQRKHQQDASFLRIEIVGCDHSGLFEVAAQRDPAAARPARLHDNDPGIACLLEGCSLEWRRDARCQPGRNNATSAGRHECFDDRTVGATIGVGDVDARQTLQQTARIFPVPTTRRQPRHHLRGMLRSRPQLEQRRRSALIDLKFSSPPINACATSSQSPSSYCVTRFRTETSQQSSSAHSIC